MTIPEEVAGEAVPSDTPGDGGSSVEEATGERPSATVDALIELANPSTSSGGVRQIYNIARVETDDEDDEDFIGEGEIPGSEEEEDSETEFASDGPSSDESGTTVVEASNRTA